MFDQYILFGQTSWYLVNSGKSLEHCETRRAVLADVETIEATVREASGRLPSAKHRQVSRELIVITIIMIIIIIVIVIVIMIIIILNIDIIIIVIITIVIVIVVIGNIVVFAVVVVHVVTIIVSKFQSEE
jgi:hypothetical protein